MMRLARPRFTTACCLVSAGLLTTSLLLEARLTQPPALPLDPAPAVPRPPAAPSDPGKGGVDSTEAPGNKATDDFDESDDAADLSPAPSPSPSSSPRR